MHVGRVQQASLHPASVPSAQRTVVSAQKRCARAGGKAAEAKQSVHGALALSLGRTAFSLPPFDPAGLGTDAGAGPRNATRHGGVRQRRAEDRGEHELGEHGGVTHGFRLRWFRRGWGVVSAGRAI